MPSFAPCMSHPPASPSPQKSAFTVHTRSCGKPSAVAQLVVYGSFKSLPSASLSPLRSTALPPSGNIYKLGRQAYLSFPTTEGSGPAPSCSADLYEVQQDLGSVGKGGLFSPNSFPSDLWRLGFACNGRPGQCEVLISTVGVCLACQMCQSLFLH